MLYVCMTIETIPNQTDNNKLLTESVVSETKKETAPIVSGIFWQKIHRLLDNISQALWPNKTTNNPAPAAEQTNTSESSTQISEQTEWWYNPDNTAQTTSAEITTQEPDILDDDEVGWWTAYRKLLRQPLMKEVKDNERAFAKGLIKLAKRLKTKPQWLLAVMRNESKLNPQAVNKSSGATWLIQWMPDTARSLGTSTSALKQMSNVEQLPYVEKYFKSIWAIGKMNSLTDVYSAVFFPAAVWHADDSSYVFEAKWLSAGKVAKSNPMFNKNKDGKITMTEFTSFVNNKLWRKIEDDNTILA